MTENRLAGIRRRMEAYEGYAVHKDVKDLLEENERLTNQLKECHLLLNLATIPMEIGPGAKRLLQEHGYSGYKQ